MVSSRYITENSGKMNATEVFDKQKMQQVIILPSQFL